MRAIVREKYGSPDVFRFGDEPRPDPRPDGVRVRVQASTVNRTDCSFRSGKPLLVRPFSGLWKPRRRILGTEFSGIIDAVGPKVQSFRVGDEVFGRTQDEVAGAWAEFLCIREGGPIAHKPANMSFEEAAALCDGVMLADTYLRLLDWDSSKRVLVNGASGSIGSAGLQLAKARGATVTAVCKTEALERILELGADQVVDYLAEDFTQRSETYDVVLDAVGKSSYAKCKPLIKDGGVYCSSELGDYGQNPFLALRTRLFGGKVRVRFPIPFYRKSEAEMVARLAEEGRYRPLIDRVVPWEEIAVASRRAESGEKVGNVVLQIQG